MGKGKQWSGSDDTKLCRSFLATYAELGDGACRPANEEFKTVLGEKFNADASEKRKRPDGAVLTRWIDMERDILRFMRLYDEFKAQSDGSRSEEELNDDAFSEYEAQYKKSFKYLHCWMVLSRSEEFRQRRPVSKGRPRKCSGPGEISLDVDLDCRDVIASTKRQKMLARETQRYNQSMLEIEQCKTEILRQQAKLAEQRFLFDLFSMRDEDIPAQSKEYFDLKRHQSLQKLREEVGEQPESLSPDTF